MRTHGGNGIFKPTFAIILSAEYLTTVCRHKLPDLLGTEQQHREAAGATAH